MVKTDWRTLTRRDVLATGAAAGAMSAATSTCGGRPGSSDSLSDTLFLPPYHDSVWGMSHSVQRGGRGIIR